MAFQARAGGPHAGVHRMTAVEFIARWVDHVLERYEMRARCSGAYALDSIGRRNGVCVS